MEGQFYLIVDNEKIYISEVLTTLSYNGNNYVVFSFEENDLVNIHVAKVNSNGMLEIIETEEEKNEIEKLVNEIIVGE